MEWGPSSVISREAKDLTDPIRRMRSFATLAGSLLRMTGVLDGLRRS